VALLCYDEMVDSAKPGDRITITGIYKATALRVNPRLKALKVRARAPARRFTGTPRRPHALARPHRCGDPSGGPPRLSQLQRGPLCGWRGECGRRLGFVAGWTTLNALSHARQAVYKTHLDIVHVQRVGLADR